MISTNQDYTLRSFINHNRDSDTKMSGVMIVP